MLAPVVRGGAAGVRTMLEQARRLPIRDLLANAAERFLRRRVELEDASPFHDAPAARAEHAARLSEAQVAAAGAGFRGGGRSLGYWGRRSEALLCPIPPYLCWNCRSHSDCVEPE